MLVLSETKEICAADIPKLGMVRCDSSNDNLQETNCTYLVVFPVVPNHTHLNQFRFQPSPMSLVTGDKSIMLSVFPASMQEASRA